MAKPNLTEEEKETIIEALNNNTEPPPEVKIKVFQSLFYLLMFNAEKLT
ncbi:MAG: hypothetical protein JRF30_00675 [Deltaproteobacteria bacterium]|nr:hypothetical protein [Deltaproteobacteria bacterium]MBW2329466.1 hypothetical protein [Deltaproteobacteria bacterium]